MFKAVRTLWSELKPKEKQYLSFAFLILAFFGILSLFIFPWLFNRHAPYKWMEFNAATNNVSSTINGIASPFIALSSAFLTFLAFWIQYQANVQQREQFDTELRKKAKDDENRENAWQVERFENRFYELIKLHRANVDEMAIGETLSGRKVFVPMFHELRFAYFQSEMLLSNFPLIQDKLPEHFSLITFVYDLFFHGIGSNSEISYLPTMSLGEKELYEIVRQRLATVADRYQAHRRDYPTSTYHRIDAPMINPPDKLTGNFYYTPFDGHLSRLGHYYRHLFQTANYIVSHATLMPEAKKGYIKMLRAQLSDFEQLLLYYNALAWYDKDWRELFIEYKLIKNLPLPLADFAERPEIHFAKDIQLLKESGEAMFQWSE